MRILLDECLPRKLAQELKGHEVDTVPQVGWSGVKNGTLLQRAGGSYDALVTIDRRFAEGSAVPETLLVVMLAAKTNRLEDLRPLVPALLDALNQGSKGERVRVGG